AHELLPRSPSTSDFVPRVELLTRLARVTDGLDDQHAKKMKVQPVERAVHACTHCGDKGGGFDQCSACKGTGIVEEQIPVGNGRIKIRKVPCVTCGQICWVFCKEGLGLEYTVDKQLLTPKEREVLARVINQVRSLKTLKKPVDDALEDVEGAILG